MHDWKRIQQHEESARQAAISHNGGGQVPIARYGYVGDGEFVVRFNGQQFSAIFSVGDAVTLASDLTLAWRRLHRPDLPVHEVTLIQEPYPPPRS